MIKQIILAALIASSLSAQEYFSKVEPFQEYVLKSNVSGKVVLSKILKEKQILSSDQQIIKIDTDMDEIELDYLEKKLDVIKELLFIADKNARAYAQSSSKSEMEKRQTLQTYLNMKLNKYEVERAIKKLKVTIQRKKIILKKGTYIDKIKVVKDDYVVPGTVLLTYNDIKRVKLKVFVAEDDYESMNENKIYINSKHCPQYKITKKALTKDKDKLSMFEIELVGNQNDFKFGDIVKVEFK